VALKIDFKKSQRKKKLADHTRHSLNYITGPILEKIPSHFINTLKKKALGLT